MSRRQDEKLMKKLLNVWWNVKDEKALDTVQTEYGDTLRENFVNGKWSLSFRDCPLFPKSSFFLWLVGYICLPFFNGYFFAVGASSYRWEVCRLLGNDISYGIDGGVYYILMKSFNRVISPLPFHVQPVRCSWWFTWGVPVQRSLMRFKWSWIFFISVCDGYSS